MPNIKDLFKKHDSSGKVLSAKSINELTSSKDAESLGQIHAYQVEKDRFFPEIDFANPSTFVKYGSAERYYEDAIVATYRMYPYDGSLREKTQWHNSSSYFDNYVFNNLYPRTNGYLNLGHSFSATGMESFTYGTSTFRKMSSPQYVYIKGGPNIASVADKQDQTLAQKFNTKSSKTSYTETSANIYDANNKKASNFTLDGAEGNTVEFWIKPQNAFVSPFFQGATCMFDLWNGDGTRTTNPGSASYGRFMIESQIATTGPYSGGLQDGTNFHMTYMSGTTGASRVPLIPTGSVSMNFNTWSHVAFSVKNVGNQINIKSYFNGKLIDNVLTGTAVLEATGALNANIGAYRTFPDHDAYNSGSTAGITDFNGWSAVTGSVDEFRYWKTARTTEDISKNWFTQVYGGTNTDDANTDLGVYLKFNEGITGKASYDAVALDYSGRISNGQIQNYTSTLRETGSAIVIAEAAEKEFKDPIIYSFHPDVTALLNDKKAEGQVYDATNTSAMHTTIPTWIAEDDKENGGENLAKIMQVMATYFDTLQLQLDFLPRMKDAEYTKFSELRAKNYADAGSVMEADSDYYPAFSSSFNGKPQPFTKFALQSLGIEVPEIFTDANALEQFRSRDEKREYKDKLYNIKNQIYQNIYNNLHFILKSKGTEKAFRNMIRCFGVDDELVRLNLYGNNIDFELKNNFRSTAVKRTYVDFMDVDRQGATVYMMTSSANPNANARSYIPCAEATTVVSGGYGMTFQTEVYFPNKGNEGDTFYQPFDQLTSSLYGVHTAITASTGADQQGDTTWNTPDVSDFQVYAVRPEVKSPHAYFQLTSSALAVNITTDVYNFVYDNEKWNFAVRVKPIHYPWANAVTGTNSSSLGTGTTAEDVLKYEVSFYGAHADLDVIVDEFSLSTNVSASVGDNFMSGSKRVYIGAHRTNFTGTLLHESDVRISSTRAWMDYLTDDEIRAHARDADNKGVLHPYKNAFVFQDSQRTSMIPRSDLLIFEWDYTNVTSSDAGISGISTVYDARFVVEDISSGSTTSNFAPWITDDRYGDLRNIVRNQYTGQGDFFEPNNDQVVDHIYIHSAKQDAPEVINSSDMIEILNQDDLEFTRDSRPIDYFYAVEKSMYQTISDEMLRMFATIADFNNLIGEPVNRYRGQYKDMDKLKSLFFRNIQNSPDLDKYVDFYKWIDASITKFLEQLFPASANYADDLRTIVESHVLERNAYRNKFPTLEGKQEDPEVPVLGINELTYNWKFGHAPSDISDSTKQQNNCLWFNQRAERTIPALSSSVTPVNVDKQTILDRATTDNSGSYLNRYEGSTYVLRKLSKPYKEGVSFSKQIKGGVNFDHNKKVDYWKGLLKKGAQNYMRIGGSELFVDDSGIEDRHCVDGDDTNSIGKNKVKTYVSIDDNNNGTANNPTKIVKENLVLPFDLHTTSSTSEVGPLNSNQIVYTNIHHDGYGTNAEIPMQGPFASKYEGGNQHRHVRVNDGRDFGGYQGKFGLTNRPEAWNYRGSNQFLVRHSDVTGFSGGVDAPYYRDFIAKRPVVIKNILQTTASVDTRLGGTLFHGPIGNYSHQYDVVQTSGRKNNNKYFVEQEGVGFGHSIAGLEASPEISFIRNAFFDFQLRDNKATDTVFVERFSAPGSYEAMSRGYLDPFAEEMSAYNAMPFRNLSVRGFGAHKKQVQTLGVEISASIWHTSSLGLNSLLSRHTAFGGIDAETVGDGAFHKTYRNRLRRIEANSVYTTASVFDNAFVTHMIPRSDFQYSWITASVLSADEPSNAFGFGYFPYSGEVSSSGGGFESAVNFATSSEVGVASNVVGISGYNVYPIITGALGASNEWMTIDFAGMNYIMVADSSQMSGNTISNDLNYTWGFYGGARPQPYMLNSGLLNGGGIYGYSSFKQIRNMYHPIARHLKDTNTYSIYLRNNMFGVPYMPNQMALPNWSSYEEAKGNIHDTSKSSAIYLESHIEPPLSSKFKPMRHKLLVQNDKNELADIKIDHTYTNNYDFFANPDLLNRMKAANKLKEPPRQVYDNLLNYTVKGIIRKGTNPIKGIKNLVYKETIYPKERHTYLAKSRGRISYTEDIAAASYTASLGSQRTFWGENLEKRQRTFDAAHNSMGHQIIDTSGFDENATTPGAGLIEALSVFPLDVGDRIQNTIFSIYKTPTGEKHGELTVPEFQQSITSYLNLGKGGFDALTPTASILYEYHNMISCSLASEGSTASEGFSEFIPNWDTGRLSGKDPWFGSYEEYAADIRVMGQDHTVLPEFRISEHMDYYLDKGFVGEQAKNNKYLTLEGASLSQSAQTHLGDFDPEFFNIYSHSDFLKHFEVVREQHKGVISQTKISVKCHGIKKLLPYNGFYPVNRTIQLASLMSQSFAPFLTGSSLYAADPGIERISSLLQPYYAPGIMYNTIKSGIAVDWMTITGSILKNATGGDLASDYGVSNSGYYGGDVFIQDDGVYRLPFESLINPQDYLPMDTNDGTTSVSGRIRYLDTRMYTVSAAQNRVSGAFAVWTGENKQNYSLAMNNFMAEVPNFFLKSGKMSYIESAPAATFLSGVTYYMDLDLYKTDNMVMYEGPYQLTGATSANGFQARGIHYGPLASQDTALRPGAGRYDPAPAPWTPPYFYGTSTVRFKFEPHVFIELDPNETIQIGAGNFTMQELVTYLATSGSIFFNDMNLDLSEELSAGLTNQADKNPVGNTEPGALCTKFQMQVNAAMNLFRVVDKPNFTFDPISGKKIETAGKTSKWVISPKFECPVLNFSGNQGTVFTDQNLHTKGMWRGYGDLPDSGTGIFYNLKDSFPAITPAGNFGNPVAGVVGAATSDSMIGSLKDKLFPAASQPTRVGDLADEKEIFEAVVAVPFKVINDKKVFIPLVPAVDVLTANEKGRQVVESLVNDAPPLLESEYSPGFSIIEQIQKMQKYVFPPSLDFINNKSLGPFQMYIFEFNHVLDKQDLADIWQGVMPKIAMKAEKQTSTISHFLANNELLLGKEITNDLRWMVFKVKQRAEYNYDKLLDKTVGIDKLNDEPKANVPLGSPTQQYSYNWPYDFFSLVELAKIDVGVQLGGELPITPPDMVEPANLEFPPPPLKTGHPDEENETDGKTYRQIAKEMGVISSDETVGASSSSDDNGEINSKNSILNSILNKT